MHGLGFFMRREWVEHQITDKLHRGSSLCLLFWRSIGLVCRLLHALGFAGLDGFVCLVRLHGFCVWVRLGGLNLQMLAGSFYVYFFHRNSPGITSTTSVLSTIR